MTNVGKIYKPELRAMAASRVVAAAVEQVCGELGVGAEARPRIAHEGERLVQVRIDAAAAGALAGPLRQKIEAALAPLPFKTQVLTE
jgi:fatty-acyl-CoA synthase